LSPERQDMFADLNLIVLPVAEHPVVPTKDCHRISAADELTLARELLFKKMAALIPEDKIPRLPDGRLLVGGWFAVPHKQDKLRLIFDRTPQNEQEQPLDWINLPAGVQYTHLVLRSQDTIRGSADDLECWFYQCKHDENWFHRQSVGRRITGAAFS
jgi:hypothetical protein